MTERLEDLQSRYRMLQKRHKEANAKQQMAAEEGIALKKELERVRLQIEAENARTSVVNVTDHAIVRYLERLCGIDMDELRKKIVENVPKGLEAGKVNIDGMEIVIKDFTVVTIINQ